MGFVEGGSGASVNRGDRPGKYSVVKIKKLARSICHNLAIQSQNSISNPSYAVLLTSKMLKHFSNLTLTTVQILKSLRDSTPRTLKHQPSQKKVGNENRQQGSHHRRRRRLSHPFSSSRRRQTPITPDNRN
jgi:hypothetical protein